MRVETLNDQLFFATAYIAATDGAGRNWTATGFIYSVRAAGSDVLLLVSNRHVFESAELFKVRMVRASTSGDPLLGQATEITVQAAAGAVWWHSHPDPRIDVAAMPFAPVFNAMQERGAAPFLRAIPSSVVPTVEQRADFNSVEQVSFVGYPNGIYDRVNFVPIVRQGYTATPIELDYNGLPAFLIDASVFPGSSGSPVFIVNDGAYSTKGGLAVGRRFHLLGVVAAVHHRQVEGQVIEIPGAHVAVVPELLDLGIVYRAEAINECADELLRARGMARDAA